MGLAGGIDGGGQSSVAEPEVTLEGAAHGPDLSGSVNLASKLGK